jgi:pyridoxal phosphate enzyme (YggS family)
MNGSVKDRLARVEERVAAALLRAGRSGDSVTIVGITKKFGPEKGDELIESGIRDIGENRIQEFLEKRPLVQADCRWHLVGTLQRNKATKAVGQFHLIHSVDSVKLATVLSRLGRERERTSRILLQVNTSEEASKHGLSPDEVIDRAGEISELPALEPAGLMTIGPLSPDPAAVRRAFKKLERLRSDIQRQLGLDYRELSMGMSNDFEIAVEEGATIIRLGTILLGPRPG